MRENIEDRTGASFHRPAAQAHEGAVTRFPAHATLLHEGDPARRILEVVDGAVMLTKLLPDGRRQVVELLGPGDVFGLASSNAYDASAEALTMATVVAHDRLAVERNSVLAARLLRRFEAQMCAMHTNTLMLGRMSALERVAFYLTRMRPCDDVAGGMSLRLAMTRQEIADFLGLTLETVSRAFSELKRRGIVALDRADEVRITDAGSMVRLAGAR